MNNGIVKTFIGKHIDLSKVIAVSDAYFIDRMGSGGYFVGFHIDVQLRDEPIKYVRKFEYDEEDFSGHRPSPAYFGESNKTLAEVRLQKQIDELVKLWKNVNN